METILLGLVLFVPVVWALGVLADLHRGALATSAAAREAGFDAARSVDMAEAESSVATACTKRFSITG